MTGAFGRRDPLKDLQAAADAVATAVDHQAQCIIGVALLCEIARHLGYDLRPRAVSPAAQVPRTRRNVATGRLARQFIVDHGGSPIVGGYSGAPPDASEFQQAGHLIATSTRPPLLIDPTFPQFSGSGLPDIAIVTNLPGPDETTDVPIVLEGPGFTAVYLFDDANHGWQESFEASRRQSIDAAAEIAAHLAAGGSPHTPIVIL